MPNISTVKATINGVEHTLTYNSSTGTYQATLTAPSKSSYNQTGNYYNVRITATDTAGNSTTKDASDSTLGNKLKLYVKEKVAPICEFIYPTNDAILINNKPAITFKVTDNDSGVKSATLTVDGTQVTPTATVISGGKQYTYTPTTALTDGTHTLVITGTDNDGNTSSQKTLTFKVDTVPPTLTITSPSDNTTTNKNKINIVGTTNDVTSSPVTITIKVNNVDAGSVSVSAQGTFTKEINLTEGSNTIDITATDSAGKYSSVTRTVVLNTVAPEFKSISIEPNPVDAGATYIISVKVE